MSDQSYFWTKEWQEAEAEADEDIKNGRVTRYSTVEELIADLHKQSLPFETTTCDLKTRIIDRQPSHRIPPDAP